VRVPRGRVPRGRVTRRRALGLTLAAGALAVLLLLVAAAWLLPAYLDWAQYRQTIEETASRELGGTVRIEGPISLALLPEPVLTARRVAITAAGAAGVSLDVGALRLQVALAPLLAGRIEPRALVLGEPELRVPWPLPDRFWPRSPDWRGPFAARIERGRLVVGRLAFTAIDATVRRADGGGLSVSGTAEASRIAWHVSARLGRAEADGAQGLDVALDGQGRASGLGATFSGQIAPDGTVAGRIAGRGPDLSLLVPAPAVPFRGEGRVRAAGGLASADDLALEIGGSPVQGSIALRVSPVERLDVALAASRLDLDRWLPALRGRDARLLPWAVPVGLDLSVDAGDLGGGIVRRLRAAIDLAPGEVLLREAEALLPGEAGLRASGRIGQTAGGPQFDGRAALSAPDLRTTLRWIGNLGLAGVEGLPPAVLRSGDLSASVSARAGRLSLSDLTGQIDGSKVSGVLDVQTGRAAPIEATLRFDRLALDPWLPEPAPELASLPGLLNGRLRVAAAQARLRDVGIEAFALDAEGGDGGLVVHDLAGTAEGVRLDLSGAVGAGGRIADGKLSLAAGDATPVARFVPPAWRGTPALWRGPFALQASVAGPPEALAAHIALDWADARLEASPVIDWGHRSWGGPATLRHPGAARFLGSTGLLSSFDWLGEGSLSLAGQFSGRPGVLTADGFDLTAGLLRARGQLALDESGNETKLSGQVVADSLPLPLPGLLDREPLGLGALRGWQASVRVEAAELFAAGVPDRAVLQQVDGTVTLQSGTLRLDPFTARLDGAALAGSASVQATAEPPVLALTASLSGFDITGPLTGWPLDITAGQGEVRVRVSGAGHSPAALVATASGTADLALHDGVLAGVDLPALGSALAGAGADPPGAEARAREALEGGATPFRSLVGNASLANGVLTLGDATLESAAGTIGLAGTIELPGSGPSAGADLRATLHPDLGHPDPGRPDLGRPDLGPDAAEPPAIALRLNGPVQAPRRTPEVATLAEWLADRAQH